VYVDLWKKLQPYPESDAILIEQLYQKWLKSKTVDTQVYNFEYMMQGNKKIYRGYTQWQQLKSVVQEDSLPVNNTM
jgi:hypothetical protein